MLGTVHDMDINKGRDGGGGGGVCQCLEEAREEKEERLVRWYFEPSQPQRITSGLKTNFCLSPSFSFHK